IYIHLYQCRPADSRPLRVGHGRAKAAGPFGIAASGKPSSAIASARKRRRSLLFEGCRFIPATALSYQERASNSFPSRQWAMARKNQSLASPPERSPIDISRALTAAL